MVQLSDIAAAAEILRRAAQPKKIILFGSHARGEADEDSDVDLLVVQAGVQDRVAEMVRLGRVLSPLRIPVDILVVDEQAYHRWSEVEDTVYHEARKNGRVLYEAD